MLNFHPTIGFWLALAAVAVSMLSLATGTSVGYVAAQFVALLGFAAFVQLAPRIPFAVAFVVIATLLKNFEVSQVLKIVFWQAADTNLIAPIETAWVVSAGTWGCVAAAVAYAFLSPRITFRTPLSRPLDESLLTTAGSVFLVIGLIAKYLTVINPLGSVVFVYLSDFAYAGVAAFAWKTWRTSGGKRLFDFAGIISLILILALSLQTGSKFTILAPFAFAIALCLSFEYLPRRATMLVGVTALVAAATIIHPLITYTRASGSDSVKSAAAALGDVISDPSRWASVTEESDRIESHWITRLYYGRPLGLVSRFTPNQIGDLVVVAPYSHLAIGSYVATSFGGLLPQTFGFARSNNLGQSELESVVQRKTVMGQNNSNYGLMASLDIHGGLLTVFLGMAGMVAAILGLYTFGFGGERNGIWALPWAVGGMFSMADQSLAGNLILFTHGAIIEWSAMLVVLTLVRLVAAGGKTPVGSATQPSLR